MKVAIRTALWYNNITEVSNAQKRSQPGPTLRREHRRDRPSRHTSRGRRGAETLGASTRRRAEAERARGRTRVAIERSSGQSRPRRHTKGLYRARRKGHREILRKSLRNAGEVPRLDSNPRSSRAPLGRPSQL